MSRASWCSQQRCRLKMDTAACTAASMAGESQLLLLCAAAEGSPAALCSHSVCLRAAQQKPAPPIDSRASVQLAPELPTHTHARSHAGTNAYLLAGQLNAEREG